MIKIFPCGLLDTNTYVVYDEFSMEGMVIDCGVEPTLIFSYASENKINIKYVVLTHGHFDHAEYVQEYEKTFKNAKIVCHVDEKQVLYDIEANLSSWGNAPTSYACSYTFVKEGDILTLGEKSGDTCMNFKILHTPGHTPGSMCLYDEKNKIMFTGDTLFKRSYGRTDFKYGDTTLMYASLRRLYSMDGDIIFYPGHYGYSTIKDEI
jgi:hydroxyacylglutathione hydrolase